MKFSEMKYERPDLEAFKAKVAELISKHDNAGSFEAAEEAFLEMDEVSTQLMRLYELVYIRHSIDTRDEFYNGENDWFDGVLPEIEKIRQDWNMSLVRSQFRPQYIDKYGDIIFTKVEMALKTFSPEIMNELQRENELVSEYSKLLASAQIEFEGNTYTRSQLEPFRLDPNDERRLNAWRADAGFLKENGEKLDEIYDEMVKLRDTMGKKLGYGGFTQLGYYRMDRNCYTKQDVEKFREGVVKYVVPLADKIYKKQAERLAVSYPMSYADAALSFRSGNPKPTGSPEEILETGKRFYHELSGETGRFIDDMLDNEMMDVLSRDGKAGGGYCTDLLNNNCPFIFANFNGTQGDVEVITHEAGHAFAFWLAQDIFPSELRIPSSEACELHSMSMEFFAWPWAESFFGDDTNKFLYSHLSGSLTFLPYGTMVDHFQHIMYEKPELTPSQRHEEWKKLMAIYMPWIRLDAAELPFYGEGRYWQRQAHIYQDPFYYIDYCLAQTMALYIWSLIVKDRPLAWETNKKYTRQAGTKVFTKALEEAGMKSPFDETLFREVTAAAGKWIDEFDLSGIE